MTLLTRYLLFVLALLLVGMGCSAPAPSAEFVQQADRLHAGALQSAVTSNQDLRDYVQLICDRLAAAARQVVPNRANEQLLSHLRCHLVNSPVINAFYTGGTHIYLYAGLFRVCRNEDELAAAIAHEYAHAIDLDVEKTKLKPDPNSSLPVIAWQFVSNRFSLDQQSSADDLGYLLYAQAGWDPGKFAGLFNRLAVMTPPFAAPDRDPLPVRASRFKDQAQNTPANLRKPPVADPRTFGSLQQQANSQSQPMGSPEAQLFLQAFPNCMLGGDPPETVAAQERLRPPPPPPTRLEPS